MRFPCIGVLIVAALGTSVDGLQIVPNSAKSTSLRVPADTRYQPYVEGKTDRFLISEAKNETPTKAPTGYEFSTLQEDNDILQQDDDEDEDDSESSSSAGSNSEPRLFRRKKKKKSKRNKATETPTPTPTSTETPTPTPMLDTPTPTPTPTDAPSLDDTDSPKTRAPTTERPDEGFFSWLWRRIGD